MGHPATMGGTAIMVSTFASNCPKATPLSPAGCEYTRYPRFLTASKIALAAATSLGLSGCHVVSLSPLESIIDSLHFIFSLSNYTAINVMVTAKRFWSPMKAGVGNAAQAWCRVASAIKKNVPRRQGHKGEHQEFGPCRR